MHTVKEYHLNESGVYVPFVENNAGELQQVVWAPLPGSQEAFLKCSETDVLYEGTRGNGKTVALILDFVQHVNCGFGAEWKGVLFRRSHPQLREVIALSNKWIKQICPDASYNEMKSYWQWPTGERLTFAHFDAPSQYDDYLGHAYPWIGWEELTMWPNLDCFKVMFACSRSTNPKMPRKVRATTNPYGVGHNWVMARYRLPLLPGTVLGPVITGSVDDKGNREPPRRVVHGHLDENLLLMVTDPQYKDRIRASARNESELHAWLDGSWDIVAGGILDDIWHEYRDVIIVPTFEVPASWRITRAYDHGSSKPFSVGYYAESDGSDLTFSGGRVRSTLKGDLFRVGEIYGSNGRPNEGLRMLVPEIAKMIKRYEVERGWERRIKPGPADTSIFDDVNGICIANDFERNGVRWEKADKGPHSRVQGWDQLRKRLKATRRENGIRETAGLFICDCCSQWLRTVPTLPRDQANIDDVDSDAEDHCGDETRYRLRWDSTPWIRSGRIRGP